ncbi:MAG: 1-deoxy-D-xylulose-5-phosphate synthase [Chitinispirillales bacterium]|jgi:1-deoxy-D-xylulose-5-phosphate synthase|nr:1-deoxy-D-xylulose-5-phosphate synthase [Chitinispirillales bacterium]
MSLLENINSPDDLKKIPLSGLANLAQEIRDFLINNVSKTGGHIGPSLGVIELTIALHYVYDSPKDKIVWDVGHQAYAHKLLTGRKNKFHTLRQYGGISGFPHTTESRHDAVTAGHASTSISAALGLAKARDMENKDGEVLAVIGDGSMTGGLAFEGLNNLGHSKTRMCVILNDNEMAISSNVGAVSKYLTKIITDKNYNALKANVWEKLGVLGGVGEKIRSAFHVIDTSAKRAFVPGGLFEDLGLRYVGPIDGHNIEELISVLRYAREQNNGPLLIHVITQKGKGYLHAEENKEKFHGLGAFDVKTGNLISSDGDNWCNIFGTEITALAQNDPKIAAITAAMPEGTGLNYFAQKFPERFFDVGIAEGHAVSFAAGLALGGIKPVVAIYSTFLQRAYDHLIHDIAIDNLHVVFAVDRAGLVGADGPTHHGAFDLSYLRTIPNASILTPATTQDLKFMLKYAIYDLTGPVFIRYPRGKALNLCVTVEKFEELQQICEGKNVCVLSAGHFLQSAMACVEILKNKKIQAALFSVKQVKPLSKEIYYEIFKKYDYIVLCEENTLVGGYCCGVLEIAQQLIEEGVLKKLPQFLRIGYPDCFIEQGSAAELAKDLGMSPEASAQKILTFIAGRKL